MSAKSFFSLATAIVFCVFYIAVQTEYLLLVEAGPSVNDRPIIGILTQEISYNLNKTYPDKYCFIPASYVKFVEGAGARVVPIWIGRTKRYYQGILSKVNGVLFPGGATMFNQTNGYADAGKMIYKIARGMNQRGDYFPIWGTCLGFELLTYAAAKGVEHRTRCRSQKQALSLNFTKGFRNTKMFKYAPQSVINTLRKENSTINFHNWCITRENLAQVSIEKQFRVISVNKDWDGLEFISIVEHRDLPFYGIQFHPEKDIYEWIDGKSIPHSFRSTVASQYFANFFVNETRKNNHTFPIEANETAHLIYNYPMTYTGLVQSTYEQCYFFNKNQTLL